MSGLYEAVEAIIEGMEEDAVMENLGILRPYIKQLRIALKASGKQSNGNPTFQGMDAHLAAAVFSPEATNRAMIDKYKTAKGKPEERLIEVEDKWLGGMAVCMDGPYKNEYKAIDAGMPIGAKTYVGESNAIYELRKDGLYEWIKKEEPQVEKKILVP